MSENTSLFDWHIHAGDRMSSHPIFGVIPVVTEFPRLRAPGVGFIQQLAKLTSAITGQGGAASTSGKSGLAVFITLARTMGPSTKASSITANGGSFVTVMEHRTYNVNPQTGFAPNGIGYHADDVATALARYMHNWKDGGVADHARAQDIVSDHDGWLPMDLRQEGMKGELYCTAFPLHALFEWAALPFVYAPTITITGSNATLTCNTAGATFLYTLDGSYPCAATNAQTNSGAPIAVASGNVVTAIAKKANMDDSSVERKTIA